MKPPKEDFEELKSSTISHHNNSLEPLSNIILAKFRDEISQINKADKKLKKEQSLRRIESILKTLPEYLENVLKIDIDRIKEEFKENDEINHSVDIEH
jgi:hypothetical protein